MTIREIAKELGFSTTTVSVCLARRENDPRYKIQPHKAELIRNYAQVHGYTPNLNARKLRKPDANPAVGLLFRQSASMEHQFHSMYSVMNKLADLGIDYHVLAYKDRQLAGALTLLKGLQVEHAILFSPLIEPCDVHHANFLQRIDEESSMRVDEFIRDWNHVDTLLQNMTLYSVNYQFPRPVKGGIVTGLIRMGTDIGRFMRAWIKKINDAGKGPVVVTNWCGEEEAMLEEGLLSCREHILHLKFKWNRYEEGICFGEQLARLYKTHPFRTVFAGNDSLAAGLMTALLDHGFRIPEDIGIIGFGNDDACQCFRVPLSTFDCNISRNAVEIVEGIAAKKTAFDDREEDFSYIERDSFRLKDE